MKMFHVLITCQNPNNPKYVSVRSFECDDLVSATRVILTFKPWRGMEVVNFEIEVLDILL